jgi:hypothetical protein
LQLRQKDEIYLEELVGKNITIEGKKKPFAVNKMINMFKQVMFEEYKTNKTKPRLGDFHEFHPDFKRKYAREIPLFTQLFSKILLCLAKGVSSKFLYTEQENKLLAWILEQPYDSITLESIFRKGYQLNQGNLYLTLMTIENILSYDWKSTKDNNREAREVTLRLRRIGHYIGNGDKFGHWYHFFGVMVYGLYKGRITSQFVAEVESLGSLILSQFKNEKQENYINRLGSIIGSRLRKIADGSFLYNWQNQPMFLNESYYLNNQKSERYKRKIKKIIKKNEA